MLWNHCCSAVNILSRSPWIIPFDIASFQEDSLSNLRTTLPRNITDDGRMYVLVGYTLYKEHLISLLQLCGEICGGFMMGSLKQINDTYERSLHVWTQRFLCDICITLVIHHSCIHVCYLHAL